MSSEPATEVPRPAVVPRGARVGSVIALSGERHGSDTRWVVVESSMAVHEETLRANYGLVESTETATTLTIKLVKVDGVLIEAAGRSAGT